MTAEIRKPAVGHLIRVGCFALLASLSVAPLAAQETPVVIRGGLLFTATADDVVPNPGMIVLGGKILEIGTPSGLVSLEGARFLDLDDTQTILPGIFDLHAHYNGSLAGAQRTDELVGQPVVFLANGVTSTFPGGEYDPEGMWRLRERIERGEHPGPRLYNSGPYYGTARRGWDREMTRDELFADVDLWVERGVKGFKAKGIDPVRLRWLIERAHWHGLTVTGHLDSGARNSVNPEAAILMGIDRIEHFMGGPAFPSTQSAYASFADFEAGSPEFDHIVGVYKAFDVTYDATLTAYGYYSDRADGIFEQWTDETRFFSEEVRAYNAINDPRPSSEQFDGIYKTKCRLLPEVWRAGVRISLGTDYPSNGEFAAGFSSHREMWALNQCGIPAAEVLKIATINGATAMNVSDKLGTLEPGKYADLFIVDGNPVEDIRNTRNVRWVMRGGVLYDAAELFQFAEGKIAPVSSGGGPH